MERPLDEALVRLPGRLGVRRPALATRGMVASAHPLATLAGVNVLQDGGNAVDAAVAAATVEAVVLPPRCGLGGDTFALVYQAQTGRVFSVTGSGAVPHGATLDYFRERGYRQIPLRGLLSVSVPGEVDAYVTLLERFGTRELGELLQPAIRYAEEGFPVDPGTCAQFQSAHSLLSAHPTTARVFLPQGKLPSWGDRLVQADLARTLHRIAREGKEVFYCGEMGRAVADFCQSNGGLLSAQDLAEHRTEVGEPLSVSFRGYRVLETTLPSQGFMLLEMLNLAEDFDFRRHGPLSAQGIHFMVEAKKLAFADRIRYAGDPRFVTTPVERLLAQDYARRRRTRIDPYRAQDQVPGAAPEELNGDTSYLAVVDQEGNAVSFIHSLSHPFGSGVIAGETGILLNNRAGRGFSLEETHPNVLAPGKRTMHTLNAYLVFQGERLLLVGGTPGGDQQTQWNLQVLLHHLVAGLDVQQATEAPRWASFPGTDPALVERPYELRVETRLPARVRRELAARGHRLVPVGPWFSEGSVQLIRIDRERGLLEGGSDPRRGGLALGY